MHIPRRAAVIITAAIALAAVLQSAPAGALSTADRIDNAVLNLLNQERLAHHLPILHGSAPLRRSASLHNAAMVRANTLSHQLPGEAGLGIRISRQGFNWNWAAENIAYNTDMTTNGALALQRLMYGEKAPYDGHRLNILSPQARYVGVQVYLDTAHHKIWLTEDFARPFG